MLPYSGSRRRRYLLNKPVDSLRLHPVDSIAYAVNFIMETDLHVSALAFKKELDAGLARRVLFPNISGLIVMQLYMEWANKNQGMRIIVFSFIDAMQ